MYLTSYLPELSELANHPDVRPDIRINHHGNVMRSLAPLRSELYELRSY